MLRENPAIPVMLTSYQKGMASNKPLCAAADANARAIYAEVIDYLIKASERLEALQVSKQDANAVSYGLQHVNAVITATDWANFFALRCSAEAKPDLQLLAGSMQNAMANNEPEMLLPGEWHLPFVTHGEKSLAISGQLAISAARCARVSYSAFGLTRLTTQAEDLALAKSLASAGHLSPFEHACTPLPLPGLRCENFKGFISQRAFRFGSQQDNAGEAEPIKPSQARELLESYITAPTI